LGEFSGSRRVGTPRWDGGAGGPAEELRENACLRDPKAGVVQEPILEGVLPALDPKATNPSGLTAGDAYI
jgi:hypothetical protein